MQFVALFRLSVYTKNWLEVPHPLSFLISVLLDEDTQWSLPDGQETSPRAFVSTEKHQFWSPSRTICSLYPCLPVWGILGQCFPSSDGRKEEIQEYSLTTVEVSLLIMFSLTSALFRWGEGNRKNPQSLPYYSFLCKTGLADTAYSGW